jgi:O-antigen/teichoic acid export membrane protein
VLDKSTFGIWCLFLGTTTLIEFARNGLVGNAVIKYTSGVDKADYPKVITASFTMMGILTAAGIVINCSIARWLSNVWHAPDVEYLFYLYNIVFIMTGFINQFNNIQQANFKFHGTFLSSFAGPFINFAFILTCFLLDRSVTLYQLIYLQMVGAAIALVIAFVNTRRYITFSKVVDKVWLKSLLNYGKFSFGTIISAMIFNSIDQWMLGYFISAAAVGAYSVAARVISLVEIPTGTVATIVFPQSVKRAALEGEAGAKYLYEKSVGTILAFLLPGLLFLFVFAEQVVDIIAGAKYADSVPLLRITVLYCMLLPYGRQFGTILDSIGKPNVNFYVVITSVISNIILNYFFILQYGVVGAAYGTLGASIINFLIGQAVLKRLLNVNMLNTLKYAFTFYPEFVRKYLRSPKADVEPSVSLPVVAPDK